MKIETHHIPFADADSCSADCLVAFVDFAWLFDATSQSQAGEIPKPTWLAHILNVTPSLSASCSESKHLLITEAPNLKASRLLLVNTNNLKLQNPIYLQDHNRDVYVEQWMFVV